MTRAHVRGVVREYIAENGCPDGLMCFNDDVALGAYRAVRDHDLRVPEDVAIVGHDGIEDTEFLPVPITTIVQPVEEMSRIAWEFLKIRMENPDAPPQQKILEARLEIRASSRN